MRAIHDHSARPINPFVRACFAMAMARVNHDDAERFLRKDEDVALRVLQRANASPGSTTTSGFGAEVARDAFKNFLTDLAPYSGAARLIAQAVPAAVRPVNESKYPVRTTGPTVPAWVGELAGIPVRMATFGLVSIGPAKKMAHILAWSKELGKRSDAESIFSQMLREDVAAGIDAAFFAATAGTSTAPAGLLYGVTPITPSGAGGKTALTEDLTALAAAVATGGSGNVTFIMAPEWLARLRILAPNLAASADLAASAAVPAGRVIAADAAALLVAIDSAPDILKSEEGVLHMSDAPLEIVSDTGPTTADPIRSLWQTATEAMRVIHEIDFTKRRATAVAYLDGANWA